MAPRRRSPTSPHSPWPRRLGLSAGLAFCAATLWSLAALADVPHSAAMPALNSAAASALHVAAASASNSAPATVSQSAAAVGRNARKPAGRPASADRAARPETTAVPTATSTPDPGPGACVVAGVQTAMTNTVEEGQPLGLQLELTASCPEALKGKADVLLVVDRSASMAELGKYEAAKIAMRQFVENVDFNRHRVGLVPFNNTAFVSQPLTTDHDRMVRAIDAFPATDGGTNIGTAIQVADGELKYSGRREAVGIIVLLTDGQSAFETMQSASDAARRRGVVIFTIGLGVDAAQDALRKVATAPDHFYYAPNAALLADVYDRIARVIRNFTVTDLLVRDTLTERVTFVPGSGYPDTPDVGAGTDGLRWWRAFLPATGLTLTYQVAIHKPGRIQPDQAWAEFTDGDGTRRRVDIPPVEVEVTPKIIRTVYLPQLWRNQCLPATSWADVVLAIDVSASMAEENKLKKAVAAAKSFVSLLHPGFDQAAVVAFDQDGKVAQPLTNSRDRLEAALDALVTGSGTRIDRGILTAVEELQSDRHIPFNRPVLVLLTDGRQSESSPLATDAATWARQVGITIYTIALGADSDRALLREIAGSPLRAFYVPDVKDLEQIYTQVAGVVGCR